MIAEFYLVDRGLRHRLPGFLSLDRLVVLRRVSAGSGTNGHTVVVVLQGRLPVSGDGSIGIVPIGHVAYYGTINWKNRLESSLRVLGSTLGT